VGTSAIAVAEDRPPVVQLAAHQMPGSGKPDELLAAAKIDADAIGKAARRLVAARAAV
jgi:transketolase